MFPGVKRKIEDVGEDIYQFHDEYSNHMKRQCDGVSTLVPTHEPMEQHTSEQTMWSQLSGEFLVQMTLPKHIVPAQRKRCVRCLTGEGGHINHILE